MGREKNTWQRDMQTDKQVGRQTDRQNSSFITFWAIAERSYFIHSSHNKAGTKFIWYDLVKKGLLLVQKISFIWFYACLIKDVNVFITCLIKILGFKSTSFKIGCMSYMNRISIHIMRNLCLLFWFVINEKGSMLKQIAQSIFNNEK